MTGALEGSEARREALLARAARVGAERHANWSTALFEAYQDAARRLWDRGASEAVVAGYLELVREGLALGYLRARATPALLQICLLELAPAELPALPPERALRALADAWNLCEALHEEPEWVQAYVLARSRELTSVVGLSEFLVRVLEPVLMPPAPSSFERDLAVTVLDLRGADDDFLPGDLFLVAPTVLAVRDRRRPVSLGVLLRHGRASEVIGPIGEAPAFVETDRPPNMTVSGSMLLLDGRKVELPLLVSPRAHAIARAGFVAVAAVDSQRLWVVECQ